MRGGEGEKLMEGVVRRRGKEGRNGRWRGIDRRRRGEEKGR